MLRKAPFTLPAGFLAAFGYPGSRRFVSLFWEPSGDEACYDDGDEPAQHWLVVDALTGDLYAAPSREGSAVVRQQQLPGGA